jgi:DNA-binding beta-propeller fold protein YncE
MPSLFHVGFKKESIAMMMITRSAYKYLVPILRSAFSLLYWTLILLAVSGFAFCPEAYAQAAAHFSGIQRTLLSDLGHAQGVAVDSSGNVYVADMNHNRVLLLPWTGVATARRARSSADWAAPKESPWMGAATSISVTPTI